jgi:hypothetical protein
MREGENRPRTRRRPRIFGARLQKRNQAAGISSPNSLSFLHVKQHGRAGGGTPQSD